jgi:hypothetical protein
LMDIYWNIFTMHGPMNVKFPNNTSKWQMEFNSAFKGLMKFSHLYLDHPCDLSVWGFQLNIFLTVLVSGTLCT